jgi:hypothetical protein
MVVLDPQESEDNIVSAQPVPSPKLEAGDGEEPRDNIVCAEPVPSPPLKAANGEEEPPEASEKAVQNGIAFSASAPTSFDDHDAVDYECDDLALEVNKEEFLDLMEEDEDEESLISCFFCDDDDESVRIDLSDPSAYASHLKERHSVRKNVEFLTEVTLARQRRGNGCFCAYYCSVSRYRI